VPPRRSTPAENIAAVQAALSDARRAQSLPFRALAASAILAGEYVQAREWITKAEQAEVRRG
jgi:hypothetical protein